MSTENAGDEEKSTIIIITPPPPPPPPPDEPKAAEPYMRITRDVTAYGWTVRIQGPFPTLWQMWCVTWAIWRKWWLG